MNTGMTSYLSCDAVKIMVKEHKYPMMKRMRWVGRRGPISVSLQKKMERRECRMKWRKPQSKSRMGLQPRKSLACSGVIERGSRLSATNPADCVLCLG